MAQVNTGFFNFKNSIILPIMYQVINIHTNHIKSYSKVAYFKFGQSPHSAQQVGSTGPALTVTWESVVAR